jgi:NAD(P)-dependent dehydrogenase (short-subunit alcohol dehydrogenase family)
MGDQIRLDGRVALVTGAGRGLGRSHALALAARGAKVVVNDLGGAMEGGGADRSVADQVVDEIRDAGGDAVANHDSVATTEGARRLVQTAQEAFGTLDIVVNNAGIIRKKPFVEHTTEDMADHLAVHLMGAFQVSKAAFPVMQAKGYGRFVFTTSPGGLRANPNVAAYGAAKAGVVGLAYAVALAGAPHGVLANCLSPYGATRMARAPHTAPDPRLAALVRPELVSAVVVYLASEQCRLNHEILTAGGGAVARTAIVLGRGWRAPSPDAFTPEAVHAHLDEVMDLSAFATPVSSEEETEVFLAPVLAAAKTEA